MENPDALDEKVSEAKSLPKSSELFEPCLIVGEAYYTGTYLATFIGTTGKCYLRGSNHGQYWSVKKKFGNFIRC